MTPTGQDKGPLNADEQQYRFAHNPLAHQLFHTFRAMVAKKGVDTALADIAEAQAADRKRVALEARIDALEYAKISPKFKIEERIEALKQELEEL